MDYPDAHPARMACVLFGPVARAAAMRLFQPCLCPPLFYLRQDETAVRLSASLGRLVRQETVFH